MPQATDSLLARVRDALLTSWFRPHPGAASRLLAPLAWVYGLLQRRSRAARERQGMQTVQPACPVVVVGNLIVGGAGKTPTTLAIVAALRAAGHTPGVVSRGHGRRRADVLEVTPQADPTAVGDEPLLIRRRTAVPVVVGRDRVAAARHLLQAHSEVDVIVSDDGLQHRQLRRAVEVIVFDERGIGNGCLLPAGPLREPFDPAPPVGALVLYNHATPSTSWPGACSTRRLRGVWPLARWLAGGTEPLPLATLQGRPLLAMAGIAVPERFFAALEAAGLAITRLPMPDHHAYAGAPWPAGTRDVVTTEKDAVKLAHLAHLADPAGGDTAVWVVGLDLNLPDQFVAELLTRLAAARTQTPGPTAGLTPPKGPP